MKNINLIFILCININLIKTILDTNPKIAVFPFKTYHFPNRANTEQFSSKDFMDIIHNSLIYLDLEISKDIKKDKLTQEIETMLLNNKQFLTLFVVIDNDDFYISDNYFMDEQKKKNCHYSTFLSSSYEVINDPKIHNMKNCVIASDYIKIFNNKNIISDNEQLIKIHFRHSYDNNKDISFACGCAGLLSSIDNSEINKKSNFINQIRDILGTTDYSFSIQYNSKDNLDDMEDGILIIGEEALERVNNQNLIPIYAKPKGYNTKLQWEFDINRITVGNKSIENIDEYFDTIIKANIDGIQIPYFFYQELNSIFFNKYYSEKICQNELTNNLYVIISCNSDLFTQQDIDSFPEINFFKYNVGFNFTFTGKDLFSKKGDKYFFKMAIYFQNHFKCFYFGRLFLKKYKVIFNPEFKSMYFFENNKNINVMKNEVKNNNNSTLISFGFIFIGILFLIIGIFLGRRYCIKRRKLYANELEDDNYAYESKEKNIKENKLIDV